MRILQLMSGRGWSSDAYWAVRVVCELERRGHEVTLGCRRGTDERVIDRARAGGVRRLETFAFTGGLRPRADAADVRRLMAALPHTDVVHVHRGKEHLLAVVANRLSPIRRPVVRTRHIVQAVRSHAGNAWLYARTALVVTVTAAIRGQYLASGLVGADRVVALPGGADADLYRPRPPDPSVRRRLGGEAGEALVGMISGFRVMKGHGIAVDALARLAERGVRPRAVFIGRGGTEAGVRDAVRRAGLGARVTLAGFVSDLPAAMAAFDVALYVPLESDGMSRVVFEYLAGGCALIATRVGVVPEILTDGEHALLVPAGDAGALAAALVRLLAEAPLRRRLAEAGRRLVEERYSGARLAEALEGHYTRLLGA
jgi:glycosyltransferase involved in cell wall biosynthesis